MNHEDSEDQDIPADLQPMDRLLKSLYSTDSQRNDDGETRYFVDQAMSDPPKHFKILQVGERFGPYEIKALLGFGSYGVVYHAIDTEKALEVALKLPRSDCSFSDASLRRFKREPQFLDKLNHPSIVALADTGMIDQTLFIAMVYQKGCDLQTWMLEQSILRPEGLVVEWGMQLASALEHAFEQGVVHRDLKPGNIIVVESTQEGETPAGHDMARRYRPMITDYGLAFSETGSIEGSTIAGTAVGTCGYMPPEQLDRTAMSDRSKGDIRGDIYSLGIILTELALGRAMQKPNTIFEYVWNHIRFGEVVSLRQIKRLVHSDLYYILNKCVKYEPDHRYQRPQELYDDLKRFQSGLPLERSRSSSREDIRRIVRRNPVLAMSVFLSFIFMTTMIAGLLVHQYRIGLSQAQLIQTSYNANVRNGYTELNAGRVEGVHDYLESTFRMEQDSKTPLRELAWNYLRKEASRDYVSHPIKEFDLYLPGRDAIRLRAMLDAYQAHTEEKNRNFVSPRYYATGLKSQERGNLAWLDEKHGTTYVWCSKSGEWYYSNGHQTELLAGPDKFDEIYCNPSADRFYYLSSRDATDGKSNRSVRRQKHGNRTNIFLNGFVLPAISLDGEVVTGLCRLQPGSGKLAWVVYSEKSGEMLDTGLEIPELAQARLPDYRTAASQSGRFVTLYLNNRTGLHVFDTVEKKMTRIPLKSDAMDPHDRTVGIDETRELLLTGDYDGNIELFRIGTEKPLAIFPKLMDKQTHVGFLPDGRCYINQKFSDRVWIWDPFRPQPESLELDHTDEVWSLAFDQSGQYLVSTGDDHHARLWDLKTRQGRIIGTGESLITRGRFSDDQSYFAACDYSGFLMIWETAGWKLVRKIQVSDKSLRSLAWGPGRDLLICVGKSDNIVEYHMNDDSIQKHHIGTGTNDVVYSRAHDEFVIGVQDSVQTKLVFMKFPGGKVMGGLNPSRSPTRFALDKARDRLLVGFHEGGFGVVSLKRRSLDRMVDIGHSSAGVLDLACTPDGRNVLSALDANRTLIYETAKWEKIGEMNDHDSPIHAITISPDAKKLATGDMSGRIRVIDISGDTAHP